ncbi:HEAT repeat domain-containing protein [Streptomyces griseocarneus]|uniref:HEAT repeat domain-containing protein n=1 Tax=Streptomyces griseocarneus TaxID=51201 RepID=UPI00167CBC57|nr:HEAT repeat domain-containing protein [Streptomyces griseocarneus]MBZ6477168.1 HEAT repeat domain-containing protein [Streptomyces griseocarneus]GHG53893.1 hypothetical protein GCM10018779_16290 [Streptomyces griseocarneus]
MNTQATPAPALIAACGPVGAAVSLETVVDPDDAPGWIALDRGIRAESWGWSSDLPSMAWARAGEPPANEASLAVALCHPDGRVRQAALEHSADVPAVLPLVVVRCADWVPQVRDRARALLGTALPSAPTRTVAVLAAVILRVARRRHGAYARELLVGTLRGAEGGPAEILLVSRDRLTRRLGHRIAIDRGRLSPARLAHIAATDGDVVVQDLCADAALAAVGSEDAGYAEVVRPLLGSRHPRVRAAGVTALHRAGRAEEATAHLADRSGLVRACARWVVRQHGIDPQAHYRRICAGPAKEVSRGAAAGLGECGTKEDADLLRTLAAHPDGRVRARAVAALHALGAAEPEFLRPLIDDPSAAVAREATTALVPSAERLPEAWLWERLAADRPRHVRSAACRLLAAHRSMVQLRCHLTLLHDAEPALRDRARFAVRRWSPADAASSYAALSPADRRHLDTLIDRATPVLGEHTTATLRWYLTSGA